MNSKERSNLRAIAAKEGVLMQVGKNGISENLIKSLSDALEAREIIKLNVLSNGDLEAKEVGEILATKLNAEFVGAIGKKAILYRRSAREDFNHIEF